MDKNNNTRSLIQHALASYKDAETKIPRYEYVYMFASVKAGLYRANLCRKTHSEIGIDYGRIRKK